METYSGHLGYVNICTNMIRDRLSGVKLPRLPNLKEIDTLTRIIISEAIVDGKALSEIKLIDVINVRKYFNFQLIFPNDAVFLIGTKLVYKI